MKFHLKLRNMKVQIKSFVFLCLLSISISLLAQDNSHSFHLGFKFSAGHATSEANSLISLFDPIQVKSPLLNSWSPSVYLEQRLFNSIAIHMGASYMNSNYSYLDKTVSNYGYYDAFTSEYTVKAKMKFLETEFGLTKLFFPDASIRPYLRLSANLSFTDADTLDFIETANNTTYQTKLGFSSKPMLGISPEIGVILPTSGKGAWVFSLKSHRSMGELMGGEFASINQNFTDANFSSIKAIGNYVHIGIAYQVQLSSKKPKDKTDKEELKSLKRKEAEEKAAREKAMKEEKQRLKEQEENDKAAAKEQEELDRLKAQEEKDKLKTDASGKPKELMGRSIKMQEEFEVNSLEIELAMWDDGAEIDGDSIMVFFNGEWIATDVGLTKEKQTITLTLNPKGKNYLIIYAINEGIHSPNTCAISFFNGTKDVRFRIHSKINENGAVSFKYKE